MAAVATAVALVAAKVHGASATFDSAARITNEFGLDLYRQAAAGNGNVCLSPYSVSCALAMTLAGADGATRDEMARVLRARAEPDVNRSFAELQRAMEQTAEKTRTVASRSEKLGGPSEPITIAIANRLFPQSGYQLRPGFVQVAGESFHAPPEPLDYKTDAGAATKKINDWVAQQTRDRIRDLIPGILDKSTRLVLANAIYLKAPWAKEFSQGATRAQPFHVAGGDPKDVPTMQALRNMGYAQRDGYRVVSIPYSGAELQLVVFVPDALNGINNVERSLTAEAVSSCAKLELTDVDLYLPKFKFAPPTIPLADALKALGMATAFDVPPGSANFDRMSPRKPNDYLAMSEVFHKTFIAVDEKGTEAAAATAVAMLATARMSHEPTPKPIEVRVDRPFLYAIQHVPSGACLFIGRVTDPR